MQDVIARHVVGILLPAKTKQEKYLRVNDCVPNTFQPSRDPSTDWRCNSAAGAILPGALGFRVSVGNTVHA